MLESGKVLALVGSNPELLPLSRLLWLAGIVAELVLLGHLWTSGLRKTYPALFSYFLIRLLRSVLLWNIPWATESYAWAWSLTAPVSWLVSILVVLELYSSVLRGYPGIASLGRWVLGGATGAALAASLALLLPNLSSPGERYPRIAVLMSLERTVDLSLLVFLLLAGAFLVWYPVPLQRNVVVNFSLFSIYYLASTLATLFRSLSGSQYMDLVNTGMLALVLVCLLAWIWQLTPRGEARVVSLRQNWLLGEGERLVRQLESINTSLLRRRRN